MRGQWQNSRMLVAISVGLAIVLGASVAAAQGGGPGHGGGAGHGGGQRDEAFQADRDDFRYLLAHHEDIQRTVTVLPDGVRTVTESDDPAVAERIKAHVAAMHRRIEEGDPIHRRDPLFAAVFQHADSIALEIEETDQGVIVTETSDDERVVPLIQAHAAVVSLFVENGHAEVRQNHAVPPDED